MLSPTDCVKFNALLTQDVIETSRLDNFQNIKNFNKNRIKHWGELNTWISNRFNLNKHLAMGRVVEENKKRK